MRSRAGARGRSDVLISSLLCGRDSYVIGGLSRLPSLGSREGGGAGRIRKTA